METATVNQELIAAQERLLAKRQDLKAMENPGLSSPNTDLTEIIERCKQKAKDSGVIDFPATAKEEKPKSLLAHCGVDKKYLQCSFENFQGGEKIKADLLHLTRSGKSVLLAGNTGCGKTHLSVAMLAEYLKHGKHDALFIALPDLLLEIRSSFSDKGLMTEKELVDLYSSKPFLVLDDMGAEKPTEFTVATLSLILDRRIRQERQTIITTNLISIKAIEEYSSARIASRISEMETVKVSMPDYRKKRK